LISVSTTGIPGCEFEACHLTNLDSVADAIVARLAPLRYAIAASEAQREDVFRLRYRAVIDRGWACSDDLPDGMERDDDDNRAVLIGAWVGTKPVAAARMIFPAPSQPLPVEVTFGIDIEPRGQVVQVDRITVDRAYRSRNSRLLLGLIARCWLEMRQRGFHVWAGTDSPGMLRLYRRLGFDMTVLGPARRYWGEDRFPVRFDPATVADLSNRLGDRT
jgi:N-acyl-L-homoserine lactone synthetase